MERVWQVEMSRMRWDGKDIRSAGIINIRETIVEGTTEMLAEHDRGGDEREGGSTVPQRRSEERTNKSSQSEIHHEGEGSYPTGVSG